MTASNHPAASLRKLDVGAFMTIEKLASGGSLQARKLVDGSVQFYWRFSHEGRTHREPIGAFDPGAPPKKLEPSRLGYSTAAARERCRQLATQHQQRKHSGGLREARVEERAAFEERKVAQAERATRTLARLFETYVGHLRSQGRRSHADAANIFRNHVAEAWPKIADKPAAEVKAEDVLDILRRLVERGHGRTANKLRAYLRAANQCAIDVRAVATLPVAFRAFQIEVNPVASTKRDPAFDTADKRPMSAEELRTYWAFIKRIDGPRGAFLRLHLLTGGQRVQQLIRLRWLDTTADAITIYDGKGRPGRPARAHVVPLLAKAATALREFPRAGAFVVSTSGGRLPIEPSTASNWAHETVAEAIPGFQLKRVRSGVETLLASQGVSREIRGHLQSHGLTGVQYRHYDGHDYLPEKRRALELLFEAIEPPKCAGRVRSGSAAEQAKRRRALGKLGRDLDKEMRAS
ncbi:MAG: integrase [Rubrivivax sp.]|nr:integrase [Rubrivivax sp.]